MKARIFPALLAVLAFFPIHEIGLGHSARAGDGSRPSIKIGFVDSRSGVLALIAGPKNYAARLAVKEINDGGGVLGRELELLDPDAQSDNRRFQELTRMLIQREKVDVLFAGTASAEREVVRPIVDQYKALYFYCNQYEGGVADKYTFCLGPVPEQQIDPLLAYAARNYGRKAYIVAADYNFGQLSAKWTHALSGKYNLEIVGEEFAPLATSQFSSTIDRIQKARPDFIISYLVGDNHASFYPQLRGTGLSVPVFTTVTLTDHKRFQPPIMENTFISAHYVEELDTPANRDFVARLRGMFPDTVYIGESAQNTYAGVYLYAMAVEKAGTTEIPEKSSKPWSRDWRAIFRRDGCRSIPRPIILSGISGYSP
ncbi:MAG: ABC transporter substrate-binding protein [Planctomycetota bacterium]|jgi:branched-chain amino acid transport system substrate-binding protein|nr:ABC transporter substrate-binding protein [Planctomycetota bacterium]